jgi:transposase
MKVLHIIGADLSKESIDLATDDQQHYLKISNSSKGFRDLVRWVKSINVDLSQTMIVMEHTGHYSYNLEAFLHEKGILFCKVSALAIKRSLGMIRGKNDKIDALRIARYGFEKRDMLQPAAKPHPALQRLQMLQTTRERLVRHRAAEKVALKGFKSILKPSDVIIKASQAMIKSFTDQIEKIQIEIDELINAVPEVKTNCELLQSITGVGPIVALATVVKTKNFTNFTDARKFACYCGTAPFEHSSGKSIRKKSRVSHLADKGMKTLLDQSAKSAIQYDKELKAYYERRTREGKAKMAIINIVRNKIIYRMFAVIKRQSPFIKAA